MLITITGRLGKQPMLKKSGNNSQYYQLNLAYNDRGWKTGKSSVLWICGIDYDMSHKSIYEKATVGSLMEICGDISLSSLQQSKSECNYEVMMKVGSVRFSLISLPSREAKEKKANANNENKPKDESHATDESANKLENKPIVDGMRVVEPLKKETMPEKKVISFNKDDIYNLIPF